VAIDTDADVAVSGDANDDVDITPSVGTELPVRPYEEAEIGERCAVESVGAEEVPKVVERTARRRDVVDAEYSQRTRPLRIAVVAVAAGRSAFGGAATARRVV